MSEKIVALARFNLPVYLPVTLHYKLKKGNDKYKINGAIIIMANFCGTIIVPQKLASNNKTLQTKIRFFSLVKALYCWWKAKPQVSFGCQIIII